MDVLIVDDETDICQMMSMKLAKFNHDVTTVHSVTEAARLIEAEQFDRIFLDIHLPDGTGFDLLQRYPDSISKTVMMSAFEGKEELTVAKELGVSEYLQKPFRMSRVLELVQS